MKFVNYHLERPGRDLDRQITKACDKDMKIAVWNAFVDSELPGITDDDFSIRPRVLHKPMPLGLSVVPCDGH